MGQGPIMDIQQIYSQLPSKKIIGFKPSEELLKFNKKSLYLTTTDMKPLSELYKQ